MTPVEWLTVGVWLLVWAVCVLAIWVNELRKRISRTERCALSYELSGSPCAEGPVQNAG